MEAVAKRLLQRGYSVYRAANADEARDIALLLAPDSAVVGIGGSMSVKEIGLADALRAKGHEVLWHWEAEPAQRAQTLRRAMNASCYYLSANALLADGRIVNIDGNGNRVAMSLFGPSTIVFIVGSNKVVEGGIDDALARIRRVACPANARRLGLKTPCAATGECVDCDSPQRMCKGIAVLERPTGSMDAHVILVDEALGF